MGNDPAIWALCSPPLTSIVAPESQIGYQAAQMLENWLASGHTDPQHRMLPPETLIARESTGSRRLADQTVHDALVYIRAHLDHDLTAESIAARLKVSRRTLHRRFLQALGQPPAAVVRRLRVETAQRMLIESDRSVTEIALDVGFGHPSQLSRAIRVSTGRSPSAFRQRIRRSSG
jgi:transcriptional regulator GlxA family with amidase domain